MAEEAARRPEPDWTLDVAVQDDLVLRDELSARWDSTSAERPVPITDLLDLRRAYWRPRVPPPEISPERRARIRSGRLLHRWVGPLLAPDARLEVRMRREGLVGRIDALAPMPIEVKTATVAVDPPDLLNDRPEHVEQLAMYCALVGGRSGRLVTIVPGERGPLDVRVVDLEFGNLEVVSAEMLRRAGALRTARAQSRSEGLPRCRWFDRGCEFRAAGSCDCTGGEPERPSPILAEVGPLRDRPDLAVPLRGRLEAGWERASPPKLERFRDLVNPRRAYYRRTVAAAPAQEPTSPLPDAEQYGRLVEAIETGPLGEVERLAARSEEPEEEVGAFRGDPYLVRTSRARAPPRADEVVTVFSQSVLELGFRCAATGRRSGRLFVAYGRALDPADRLRVFSLEFASATVFARLWRHRLSELERALAERDPDRLPACPAWMTAHCPYREVCSCAAAEERSHR